MSSPKTPSSQGDGDVAGVIEVDANDADSTYSDTATVTDTESLRSSILQYKWEHGRRYHSFQDGEYWAPNDEKQQEAEDLVHTMHRIILEDKLYLAPIVQEQQTVLDLGCGTGLWAVDFADENPSSVVIGVDLSPIQPNFVPPNCRFEVDDINKEWTFAEDHFDFIHVRAMTGCVPDWTEFHKKSLKHLKPGGWVEQHELSGVACSDDGTIKADSPFHKWLDIFKKVGDITGKTFFAPEVSRESIEAAGFVDVRERVLKVPIGTWPKDKILKQWGAWNRQFLVEGLEGFALRGVTSLLGWSIEEAQLFLLEMRRELTDPNVHSYLELHIVDGQKPTTPEPLVAHS
ncbi:Fc.00g058570.m01.CDS01 [Cosmosporella sp. VM-42]